jgi:antitoxin component of RelBE/YafQ-DinJ toxin-antitoxin module
METSVSLYKVKEDAKEIIKKLGYAAKDAVYLILI